MEKNRRFDATSILLVSFVLLSSFTLLTTTIANPVIAAGGMYWKPGFADYAPSGVPDFDQRQWGTYIWQDQWQTWSHCGPVAVANSLWWLDSEFEPNPIAPPTINDGFPLVQSYNLQWDDHDPLNVPPLIEHLAFLMDTNGLRTGQLHSGTNVNDMQAGLTHYLSWTGVNPLGDVDGDGTVNMIDLTIVNTALGSVPGMGTWDLRTDIWPASTTYPPMADNIIDMNDLNLVMYHMGENGLFYEHTVPQPDFYYIEEEVERCQDVVLLIGYWFYDMPGGVWYRESGHFVTVAGVDSQNLEIAVCDPTLDAFENLMIPEGRVPVPHMHPPLEPPYTTHNNASLVSQDVYSVAQISPPFPPCPGGTWTLVNYGDWNPTPPFFAVIESAVITSPSATQDVAVTNIKTCKDGCIPFPTVGQNYTMHINVTVENQGNYTETFAVTVYANTTIINQTQLVLPTATSTVLAIKWNTTGFTYDNYTISAVADTVCGEMDTADNIYVGSTVLVTIAGDVDGDFRVRPMDLNTLLAAYGARPYNPNCDIDDTHKIGPIDLNILLSHYGWHYP